MAALSILGGTAIIVTAIVVRNSLSSKEEAEPDNPQDERQKKERPDEIEDRKKGKNSPGQTESKKEAKRRANQIIDGQKDREPDSKKKEKKEDLYKKYIQAHGKDIIRALTKLTDEEGALLYKQAEAEKLWKEAPLFAAMEAESIEVVEGLIELNKDILTIGYNMNGKSHVLPLFYAIGSTTDEIVMLMIAKGASIGIKYLLEAIEWCTDVQVVQEMIDKEPYLVHHYDRQNYYPMYIAIRYKKPGMVKTLIDNGVDIYEEIYAKNKRITPLKFAQTELKELETAKAENAVLETMSQIIEILKVQEQRLKEVIWDKKIVTGMIEKNGNKEIKDLHELVNLACSSDDTGVLKLLIQEVPRVVYIGYTGLHGEYTLLHWAAEHGEVDLAKTIIEKEKDRGKDVRILVNNSKNRSIKTPLHFAVINASRASEPKLGEYKKLISLLLENGADPTQQEESGKIPADFVKDEIKDLFSQSRRPEWKA